MAGSIISSGTASFLKFEIVNADARRKKMALQELCRLYRNGARLNSESQNDLENAINGIVLIDQQDRKVVRWSLNALAQVGRRSSSGKYIDVAIKSHENDPEIVAAGVAALSKMYQGQLDGIASLGKVPPEIKTLAALQFTDPKKLDLSGFKINIDTADSHVLRLALIAVGLNRDIENLFDPRYTNAEIVKKLCQYNDDAIVVQYSVWSVLENKRLTIDNLGIRLEDVRKQPPNVQAKLLQLAAEKERDAILRHDTLLNGSYLPSVEAREGLAKGLSFRYYDGLADITIPWFEQERETRVKELLAEHFARFASECPSYRDQALSIAEADPSLKQRLLLGAEGRSLYAELKAQSDRGGTPDLFGNEKSEFIEALRMKESKKLEVSPLKVLFLFAAPINTTRLRLDEEARDLSEQLRLVANPEVKIEIEQKWAVRTDQIQEAIQGIKPTILHFSGHGSRGAIIFEDKNGKAVPVSDNAVAELMRLSGGVIECLVLNACFSESIAKLASPYVKAVIGCDDSIADDAGIAFSRSFYRSLASGYAYKTAFDWAVNEVRIHFGDGEASKYTCY